MQVLLWGHSTGHWKIPCDFIYLYLIKCMGEVNLKVLHNRISIISWPVSYPPVMSGRVQTPDRCCTGRLLLHYEFFWLYYEFIILWTRYCLYCLRVPRCLSPLSPQGRLFSTSWRRAAVPPRSSAAPVLWNMISTLTSDFFRRTEWKDCDFTFSWGEGGFCMPFLPSFIPAVLKLTFAKNNFKKALKMYSIWY